MSFINPIFLFATSAALLPILYHLIRKIRARKVKFSSLLFLIATPKALIKKRRLRDLLLLIIRACILGFLALSFARPFIPREKIPLVSQISDKSVVILLDNSYSMQYGNLFERAQKEAVKVIDNAGIADECAVVVFSDKPQQVSELSNNFVLHKNIVMNTVTVSNHTTDLYKPLRLAEEILKDARHQERCIVLISDFQSNGWSSQFENWNIEQNITFIPKKIAEEKVTNFYINKFTHNQKRIGEATAVQYRLQISTQGSVPEQVKEVSLWVNGREVDKKMMGTVQSHQVFFQQTNLREGSYQGYVMLNKDNLIVDNFNYFSFLIEKRPSILCIDSAPKSLQSNAFFLKNCFSMGEQTLYDFSAGGNERLTPDILKNNDVVFLTNVSSLTSQQVILLKEFVEKGGGIIISFGGQTNLKQFSRNLSELGIGSLNEKVAARTLQSSDAIIGEVDLKHPIFSVFAQSGTGDISRPRFREYMKVIPDTNAVVIGKYDTNDAFMIERIFGKGKILVFTSTLNTEWGDFPVNEIYLPFVYQLVKYILSSSEMKNTFLVGDPVSLYGRPGDEWEVKTPDEKFFKVTMDKSGTGYFRETEIPGNYKAAHGNAQRYFSVNVETLESDLTSKDEAEVYTAVAGQKNQAETRMKLANFRNIAEEEKDQKLWRYILLFIIMLFLFETFFANRKVDTKFRQNQK